MSSKQCFKLKHLTASRVGTFLALKGPRGNSPFTTFRLQVWLNIVATQMVIDMERQHQWKTAERGGELEIKLLYESCHTSYSSHKHHISPSVSTFMWADSCWTVIRDETWAPVLNIRKHFSDCTPPHWLIWSITFVNWIILWISFTPTMHNFFIEMLGDIF